MSKVSLVCVFNSSGFLLLGKRTDSGLYTICGGHAEGNESPEDCARREVKEESGLDLMSLSFLKYQINKEGVELYVFSGYASGDPKPHGKDDPDSEVLKWEWVDINGGLDSRYYKNLHGPETAEGGNILKQLFDIKEKGDKSLKKSEEDLSKAVLDPNAGYSFIHQDPNTVNRPGAWSRPGEFMLPGTATHTVRAFHQNKNIGYAHFSSKGLPSGQMNVKNVYVDEPHRRKGLASAMYSHAEKQTGKKLVPSKRQTNEGKSLWGGNANKQQFGQLNKSEGDEITRLLSHNDPNERLMGLRLNTITPDHLQIAAHDQDPNVWRAAVDHPMFDDLRLMNSPASPLEQQSYLLSKPDRAKSHYLDAMWQNATLLPFDQRSNVLDVIAAHPLAEVNLIRSLYLDVNTNPQQRAMLVGHQNASTALLLHVVETALRLPSNESLELAKIAIRHTKMPVDMIHSLVKMAVEQPQNKFVQALAQEALSDKFIDKSILDYLIVQNKLRPGTNVGGLIATALSGPSGKQYDVDTIIKECGPGLWDGTQKLPVDLDDFAMNTLVQYAQKVNNKVLLQRLMDHTGFKNSHLDLILRTNSIAL